MKRHHDHEGFAASLVRSATGLPALLAVTLLLTMVPTAPPPSPVAGHDARPPGGQTEIALSGVAVGPGTASPEVVNGPWNSTAMVPWNSTWQWQLTGLPVNNSVQALTFDIDMFANSASEVAALHAMGKVVICYVDAGTWESWRPDNASFPSSVLGKNVSRWPGERWLDISNLSALEPIMEKRLDLCKSKGFDGVEGDNVDGYLNPTGFNLTYQDQFKYNMFFANYSHKLNLAIALKNDLRQYAALLPWFDFALDEECFEYTQCTNLTFFTSAHKAAFDVEYNLSSSQFCPQANTLGFRSMLKHLSLDAYRVACWASNKTAPYIQSTAPSGTLPTGTTSATIVVDTSSQALCRFSTTQGVLYGSMPYNFSSATNMLSHTIMIDGLSDGANYTFYAKCMSMWGVPDTSDTSISFSVSVLSSVNVTPHDSTISTGGVVNFSATPSCRSGACHGGVTYAWSLNSALGSLNSTVGPSVTLKTGTTTGTLTIMLSARLNGVTKWANATVTITAKSASGFLGLPGYDGYILIGVAVALAAIAAVVLLLRGRGQPPTPTSSSKGKAVGKEPEKSG